MTGNSDVAPSGAAWAGPNVRFKSVPALRYELIATIEGVSGPFDEVTGYIMHQVGNSHCLPLQPGSGATLAMQKRIPLTLVPAGTGYTANFHLDALLDEDYFGRGVCRWYVGGIGLNLTAHRMVFSPGLSSAAVQTQASVTSYFAQAAYRNPARSGSTTGTARSAYVESHPAEFFSVTLRTVRLTGSTLPSTQ